MLRDAIVRASAQALQVLSVLTRAEFGDLGAGSLVSNRISPTSMLISATRVDAAPALKITKLFEIGSVASYYVDVDDETDVLVTL